MMMKICTTTSSIASRAEDEGKNHNYHHIHTRWLWWKFAPPPSSIASRAEDGGKKHNHHHIHTRWL
jgi:hypothetical protein